MRHPEGTLTPIATHCPSCGDQSTLEFAEAPYDLSRALCLCTACSDDQFPTRHRIHRELSLMLSYHPDELEVECGMCQGPALVYDPRATDPQLLVGKRYPCESCAVTGVIAAHNPDDPCAALLLRPLTELERSVDDDR